MELTEFKRKEVLIMTEKDYQKFYDLFNEDEELFNRTIEELDAWNGYLHDDRYYSMYEFDELMSGYKPWELACRISYGEFNPNDDYFRFNGYGNVVSSNWLDYSDHLDEYFINELINEESNLDLDPSVQELIDELN